MNKPHFGKFIKWISMIAGFIVFFVMLCIANYGYRMDKIRTNQKKNAELIHIIDSRIKLYERCDLK